MVKEADVQIYAIGLYDRDFKTAEEREGPQLLSEVSDVTGGRTFTIGTPTNWLTWPPRSELNCATSTYLDTVPPIRLGMANGERLK